MQRTLIIAIAALIRFLKEHEPKVAVKNQVKIPTLDFSEVTEAVKNLTQSVESKETDFSEVVSKLDGVEQALSKLPTSYPEMPSSVEISNQHDYSDKFDALQEAIAKIDVKPEIKITEKKIDLKPIETAVKEAATPPQFDLSTYRAQDLDEMEPGIQYVGFTNIDGYWYILRNDVKNNNMRYKFGKDNYSTAWEKAPIYDYQLLEEAMNAIKA